MSEITDLNELFFIPSVHEMCKDILNVIMDKMNAEGEPEIIDLPNGGIRILSIARNMDINAFWDKDTGVMRVFIPELAEQLEKVRQIKEIYTMSKEQKNVPYTLSGITIDDLPVIHEMAKDYYAFVGNKPKNEKPDWHSDVEFGIEMSYDPNAKQGTPFKIFTSCNILCNAEIKQSLKNLMSFGMDKNTAQNLNDDFMRLMIPAKSYLVGGDAPNEDEIDELRENLAISMDSIWLITDITSLQKDDQREEQKEGQKAGQSFSSFM